MVMSRMVSPDTPLTPEEQLFSVLHGVRSDLAGVIAALQGLNLGGGGGTGGGGNGNILSEEVQTVIAARKTAGFPLASVVSLPVTVLARLVSDFEDMGILSKLGTPISITDLTKFWEPGIWVGHTLFVLWGSFLYVSQITANTNQTLAFLTLPNSAQPDVGAIYWIQPNPSSTLGASKIRWGIATEPTWIYAASVAAPAAGTALVTRAVGAALSGYIFGLLISVTEANNFRVNWVSGGIARSKLFVLAGPGTVEIVDQIALNTGLLADPGSVVTITNVNVAGVGSTYQANLLYAEL